MIRVYLNMCAIQRPLDTPSHVRIQIEAEVVLGLISLGEAGHLTLVSSDALHHENDQNPLLLRREYGFSVLARATETIALTEAVRDRAQQFLAYGLKPLDALHVALAEAGKVDYFCTCDDRLRRQAQRIVDLTVNVVTPIDLIQKLEPLL